MEEIRLACDMSEADEFCTWLKAKLPGVHVSVGKETRTYINGIYSIYSTYSDELRELWEEYCNL